MKHKFHGFFIILLGVFLLIPLSGTANASNSNKNAYCFLGIVNNSTSPKKIFISVKQGIVHFFRGAKNTTKRTARNVGHGVVRGAKEVKSGTKQTAKTVGHGVTRGAREVGSETKKTARMIKKDIVKAFHSLKNQ